MNKKINKTDDDVEDLLPLISSVDNKEDTFTLDIKNEIFALCDSLSLPDKRFQSENWLKHLSEYINNHDRLLYAYISSYIFDKSDKLIDRLLQNLGQALSDAHDKKANGIDGSDRLYKTVLKFYDHANLAQQQRTMFTQQQGDLNKLIDGIVDPKVTTATKELTSQLVGLVSIFTALSFIIFGGISSLDSIFKSLSKQGSLMPVLLVVIGWAFCIINTMNAFMYFVIRIANLQKKAQEKEEKNLVKRHPMIFLSNYILCVCFLVCLFVHYTDINGIGINVYNRIIQDFNTQSFWIGLVVLILIIISIGLLLWCNYRNCKQKSNKQQ